MVRVTNIEQSLDFYCKKLGMEEVRRVESEAGRYTLVFLAAPQDKGRATAERAPLLELTFNWDPEKYGEGRNFGYYSNPKVDELYKQGRLEFDRKKRAEIYGRIHTLVYEDQPYTFLYYRNSFYAFNKKLRGYNYSPRGPYHYGPGFSSIYKVKN